MRFPDFFANKTPNKVPCECGFIWTISQRVQRRGLHCPECRRYYWYLRNLNGSYKRELIGRFKGKNEVEKRTLDYAKTIGN